MEGYKWVDCSGISKISQPGRGMVANPKWSQGDASLLFGDYSRNHHHLPLPHKPANGLKPTCPGIFYVHDSNT